VFCLTCGAEGPLAKTRKAAIAAWNTRANGSEPMREALEAFMALPHLDDDICEVGSGCKVCAAIEQARAGLAGK